MTTQLDNVMMLTDSYKVTHWKQYPPGSEIVYSYLEARGGLYKETVFFGLQYLIKKYLSKPITQEQINTAETYWNAHFGQSLFNREGWEYILRQHSGFLPLRINAVPEGTVVPTGNVLMTIENTDPHVPWLTNWMETLLMQIWYPITVATQSREMKKTIYSYLETTGSPELIDFKLHDFGFRGSTSVESSAIGGAAHLVNFKGTDTASALVFVNEYYNMPMAGFSIPASEHSTITSWGKDRELDACRNMLEQYPTGLVACVSDSYDIFNACENIWGTELKEQILARDGCLVVRPDSGDPLTVLPRIMNILGDKLGYTVNPKGFKVLNDKVRVIQGDGIEASTLKNILHALHMLSWSTDNIAFGSGGGLLQKVNRDTCKMAIKCSSIRINGIWFDVQKDPVTDTGKRSKKGKLSLVKDSDGNFVTVRQVSSDDVLIPYYHNGYVLSTDHFNTIRERAAI